MLNDYFFDKVTRKRGKNAVNDLSHVRLVVTVIILHNIIKMLLCDNTVWLRTFHNIIIVIIIKIRGRAEDSLSQLSFLVRNNKQYYKTL
jgi:hypothetical protein